MMEISVFWAPCWFCQWNCEMELLDKTAIKYTYTGVLVAIYSVSFGARHRKQSLTALNRWYVGIQDEYHLECSTPSGP